MRRPCFKARRDDRMSTTRPNQGAWSTRQSAHRRSHGRRGIPPCRQRQAGLQGGVTTAAPIPTADEIVRASRALVRVGFERLAAERVIPTSRYHPWIWVGRDYEGAVLMHTPEFTQLEDMLNRAYPARFDDPLKRQHAEFSNSYIFHMIEAAVRRCADDGDYGVDSQGVTRSIEEMIAILDEPHHGLAVVRAMSHIATVDGQAVTIDGIEVVPEPSRQAFDFLVDQCRQRIPAAGGAFNRERPHVFAHPHAVIAVATSTADDPDMFGVLDQASHRLDRFVCLLRLLTGTTARPQFEVRGSAKLAGPIHAQVDTFGSGGITLTPFVRRTATLDASFDAPIRALGDLLQGAQVKREQMATTSLDVAIGRYTRSYQTDGLDSIVDLATALEAILIDEADGTEGITARLRNRAAALLATVDDPPANVFNDVSAFYSLRSTLVHGGNLRERTLRTKVLGITTITATDMFGIAAAEAVDRMRDLVRRAILARLCLAGGNEPLWPFNPAKGMDVVFADDQSRERMRRSWTYALARFGAASAAETLGTPGQVMVEDYSQPDPPPVEG